MLLAIRSYFRALIDAHDFGGTEEARDLVEPSDLTELYALYWKLESWDDKFLLVSLVQDHVVGEHAAERDWALDILRAPINYEDDSLRSARAIALCCLEQSYDSFMTFFENDKQAEQVAANWLVRS